MSTPQPFGQSGDDYNDPPDTDVEAHLLLEALATHLRVHEFVTEFTAEGGLVVRNPREDDVADVITCHPYAKDSGRLWLFNGWDEPLAEADRITDAVVMIKGYLKADSR